MQDGQDQIWQSADTLGMAREAALDEGSQAKRQPVRRRYGVRSRIPGDRLPNGASTRDNESTDPVAGLNRSRRYRASRTAGSESSKPVSTAERRRQQSAAEGPQSQPAAGISARNNEPDERWLGPAQASSRSSMAAPAAEINEQADAMADDNISGRYRISSSGRSVGNPQDDLFADWGWGSVEPAADAASQPSRDGQASASTSARRTSRQRPRQSSQISALQDDNEDAADEDEDGTAQPFSSDRRWWQGFRRKQAIATADPDQRTRRKASDQRLPDAEDDIWESADGPAIAADITRLDPAELVGPFIADIRQLDGICHDFSQ